MAGVAALGKRRWHPERRGKACERLSDREVGLMRDLNANHGYGYRRLAVIFEVSRATVQSICTYRTRAACKTRIPLG
jgi:hypothetical protein